MGDFRACIVGGWAVLTGFCGLSWGWYNTDACGLMLVGWVWLSAWVWDLGFRFGV